MTTYCIYDGLSLQDIMVERHSKNSVSFNIGMATYFSISASPANPLSSLPTGYFVACYYTESLTSIRININLYSFFTTVSQSSLLTPPN